MITLAIETAIQGGSLALLYNDKAVDFWIGDRNVSKAEDILEQISVILKRNSVKKIDFIVVSNGPGSSTGIRIGLATALGLSMSQGCDVVGVSVFDGIIHQQGIKSVLVAIPVGGNRVAYHIFQDKLPISTRPELVNISEIENLLSMSAVEKFILHSNIRDVCSDFIESNKFSQIEILDSKLAILIGLKGIAN